MSDDQIVSAKLPIPEAADLATRAAAEGIPADEYFGMHILKSAYGVLHPKVVPHLLRPKQGQNVPNDEE
jgi:hypothetical protein